MKTKQLTQAFTQALLILAVVGMTGCIANRTVEFPGEGNGPSTQWNPAPIPARPAGQEKIPVGVMIGISQEEIQRYPKLKENNVGLGLQYVVREQLSQSDWFTLCTVDPELIATFEKLKSYYWHGEAPEGKQASSQKPEFILMVGLTRVELLGRESVVGGVKKFSGNCQIKMNFETYPLLSDYANIQSSLSGVWRVPVKTETGIFSGAEFRSSAFGLATERAARDALPKLIQSFGDGTGHGS